jgi:hypothetical protein
MIWILSFRVARFIVIALHRGKRIRRTYSIFFVETKKSPLERSGLFAAVVVVGAER